MKPIHDYFNVIQSRESFDEIFSLYICDINVHDLILHSCALSILSLTCSRLRVKSAISIHYLILHLFLQFNDNETKIGTNCIQTIACYGFVTMCFIQTFILTIPWSNSMWSPCSIFFPVLNELIFSLTLIIWSTSCVNNHGLPWQWHNLISACLLISVKIWIGGMFTLASL